MSSAGLKNAQNILGPNTIKTMLITEQDDF